LKRWEGTTGSAARFRELASRAANAEDECYLLWRATEAEYEAETEQGDTHEAAT
jgi:hypothetical protein